MILDMDTVRFIKSFSRGQITIPKDIREAFGIGHQFWLKLYIREGKLIAEPVESNKNNIDYLKKLKKIKGEWFSNQEFISTRQQVEQKLLKSIT